MLFTVRTLGINGHSIQNNLHTHTEKLKTVYSSQECTIKFCSTLSLFCIRSHFKNSTLCVQNEHTFFYLYTPDQGYY